ncbi:methyl-accepting chemotaxis protein [Fulvimarina manganoxydans]|uniref:Methyl-accepting chemotaxis protein n=1 Tax=Fulvimarina manganoxydans TaxID=937218 RepID=A0A1W1ZZ72_9HYPH|nr:methyl-accepting chemotaxis protein [Fulvimarina manganoxydans]SMC53683.1 methyl-accepting chemotaxis protein [Fulvimarina manganoxydans]
MAYTAAVRHIDDIDAEPVATPFGAAGSVRMAPADEAAKALVEIGGSVDVLSITIAELNGTVGDVSKTLSGQAATLDHLAHAVGEIDQANRMVDDATRTAITIAVESHREVDEKSGTIRHSLEQASREIAGMAKVAAELTTDLDRVVGELKAINGFSETVQEIATQTQLLAINAGIMAARAGQEGKGFAVIAESIKQLADRTSVTSREIIGRVGAMSGTVKRLQALNAQNGAAAGTAMERAAQIETDLKAFDTVTASIGTMVERMESVSDPLALTRRLVAQVTHEANELNEDVQASVSHLGIAAESFDGLVSFAERLVGLVAHSGVETPDSALIARCMADAAHAGKLIEEAVDNGIIRMEDLFDEAYRPIEGSDPVQYITRFTELTDRIMPDIQEAMLEADSRVAFCAAIDRKGYIPTHNRIYSQPQGADPVWNAANCRNRRIFNDRTGLAAGRNTEPFLMQTYRRDMGGGVFVLMKDLSAPIIVHGRHWGGLRIGVRI